MTDIATAAPPPDASAGDLVRHMHAAVRTVDSLASDAGDRTPPACAVAVLDPAAGRVVRVGDIHVLVDGFPHPPQRALDDHLGSLRARVLRDYLDLGCPVEAMRALDPGRLGIEPAIKDGRKLWNTLADGFGSGRIDGTPQTKGVQPGANSFDDRLYLRVALVPATA